MGHRKRGARTHESRKSHGRYALYCGNLGALTLAVKNLRCPRTADFSLIVFNTECLRFFEESGLDDTELSFELTGDEIRGLGGELPRGIFATAVSP